MKEKIRAAAMEAQLKEITEFYVYNSLADICKDPHNADVLRKVGEAEKQHALFWQKITGKEIKPSRFAVFRNILSARVLGLTFALKRMEKNEGTASRKYLELSKDFPELAEFARDEAEHEKELLNMLDEERLRYAGSIVLGLNDALVELTGSLAGFTLALGNTRVISLAGLITGISASFSMATSEYLSCKSENDPRALKSALYTGCAYVTTVALLILPYLLLSEKFIALAITLVMAVFIIMIFNYYLATARDLNFKRRFAEMTLISLGVASLSFGVGFVLQKALGVEF